MKDQTTEMSDRNQQALRQEIRVFSTLFAVFLVGVIAFGIHGHVTADTTVPPADSATAEALR